MKDKMTLTVEEMAAQLNISRNTAYALTREHGFPSIKIGKRLLINRALLQQWLDAQCVDTNR